jgi:hypothetical protein
LVGLVGLVGLAGLVGSAGSAGSVASVDSVAASRRQLPGAALAGWVVPSGATAAVRDPPRFQGKSWIAQIPV